MSKELECFNCSNEIDIIESEICDNCDEDFLS